MTGSVKRPRTKSRLLLPRIVLDTFISHCAWALAPNIINLPHCLKKFIPSLTNDRFEVFFDPNPPQYDEDSVNFYGKYYDDLEDQYAEELAEQDGEEDFFFYS